MHINDFHIISIKLVDFIESNNLIQTYQQLGNVFTNAANNPNQNYQPKLKEIIQDIKKKQNSFEEISFSRDQQSIFQSFNKDRILGPVAVINLQERITNLLGNYSSMVGVATDFSHKLSQLLQTLKVLKENINPFVNKALLNIKEGEDVVTLVFKNSASVTSLEDLQERSKQWKLILQWLKCINNFEDFEIVSYEDGSCKITLKNVAAGVVALGAIITFSLNSYNSYLDIQIKTIELERIRQQYNKEISSTKIEEIKLPEEIFQQISEDVAARMLHDYSIEPSSPQYEECKTNLSQATKYILKFIDDGGELEFSELGRTNEKIAKIANYFEALKTNRIIDGQIISLIPELKKEEKDL